jgi:hypothetical protein
MRNVRVHFLAKKDTVSENPGVGGRIKLNASQRIACVRVLVCVCVCVCVIISGGGLCEQGT